jgi:hypothetical protein
MKNKPMNQAGVLDGEFREVSGPCWIDLVNSSRFSVTVAVRINGGKTFMCLMVKFSSAALSLDAGEKAELKAAGRTVTYEVKR